MLTHPIYGTCHLFSSFDWLMVFQHKTYHSSMTAPLFMLFMTLPVCISFFWKRKGKDRKLCSDWDNILLWDSPRVYSNVNNQSTKAYISLPKLSVTYFKPAVFTTPIFTEYTLCMVRSYVVNFICIHTLHAFQWKI